MTDATARAATAIRQQVRFRVASPTLPIARKAHSRPAITISATTPQATATRTAFAGNRSGGGRFARSETSARRARASQRLSRDQPEDVITSDEHPPALLAAAAEVWVVLATVVDAIPAGRVEDEAVIGHAADEVLVCERVRANERVDALDLAQRSRQLARRCLLDAQCAQHVDGASPCFAVGAGAQHRRSAAIGKPQTPCDVRCRVAREPLQPPLRLDEGLARLLRAGDPFELGVHVDELLQALPWVGLCKQFVEFTWCNRRGLARRLRVIYQLGKADVVRKHVYVLVVERGRVVGLERADLVAELKRVRQKRLVADVAPGGVQRAVVELLKGLQQRAFVRDRARWLGERMISAYAGPASSLASALTYLSYQAA